MPIRVPIQLRVAVFRRTARIRSAILMWSVSGSQRTSVTFSTESGELPCSEPLLELHHIDDAAPMRAIADLAIAVPGFDLEHQALAVDLDHAADGTHSAADRRRGQGAGLSRPCRR